MNPLHEQAETLQNMLLSQATGGSEDNAEYRQLRQIFISNPDLESRLPSFVRTCRSLDQFWQFIKPQYAHYAERRSYIWEAFQPLLDYLESESETPSDDTVTASIDALDLSHVSIIWSKALDRRNTDPEGAITMARTLVETVCKCILDNLEVTYENDGDLPKLYHKTANALSLAPSQHTEKVFKQMLGGCISIVNGLSSIRNSLSDAHGSGRISYKPQPPPRRVRCKFGWNFSQFSGCNLGSA